jgi:hypothetical protein
MDRVYVIMYGVIPVTVPGDYLVFSVYYWVIVMETLTGRYCNVLDLIFKFAAIVAMFVMYQ